MWRNGRSRMPSVSGPEAVATAEVTVAGGVAGLYNVSTRAAVRRRGIGSATTRQALLAARADGCRVGVLQTLPAGVGVYVQSGFQPYGEIRECKPAAGDTPPDEVFLSLEGDS
jgi:hypothetical protein